MTIEQAQSLLDKLSELNLGKAKGSDTAKLTRLKRSLRWALENTDNDAKQTAIDKLELNFMNEESLDSIITDTEDKIVLTPYLLIIQQEQEQQ